MIVAERRRPQGRFAQQRSWRQKRWRRALFKQAGHPIHRFLKNGIYANVFS
jgi:hypothetical protein